ncbi:hypothetical protein ECP03047775_3173, partial [Escherichia coli P0304777.5]
YPLKIFIWLICFYESVIQVNVTINHCHNKVERIF